jgi:hypothetical protein
MTGARVLGSIALAAIAACASPSPGERTAAAELAALAPLKQAYPSVVMGFDLRGDATLIVSLDLQSYDVMDDDDAAAMLRSAVERWKSAWLQAHPHGHAVLHVRFIDFIGRRIAERSVAV